eukprot:517681-Pelagomonas_calceolata.AAC.1
MTLALQHATYSATLNTETAATFIHPHNELEKKKGHVSSNKGYKGVGLQPAIPSTITCPALKSGTTRASGDLKGCWKHPAQELGYEEYSRFICMLSGSKRIKNLGLHAAAVPLSSLHSILFQSSARAAGLIIVDGAVLRGKKKKKKKKKRTDGTSQMLLQGIKLTKPTIMWAHWDAGPFSRIFWLSQKAKGEHAAGKSKGPSPAPKLTYLANLQNALKSD